MNPFSALRHLLIDDREDVGTVTAIRSDGCVVDLVGGGSVMVRGSATVGATVAIRNGVIVGAAAALPGVDIEV